MKSLVRSEGGLKSRVPNGVVGGQRSRMVPNKVCLKGDKVSKVLSRILVTINLCIGFLMRQEE